MNSNIYLITYEYFNINNLSNLISTDPFQNNKIENTDSNEIIDNNMNINTKSSNNLISNKERFNKLNFKLNNINSLIYIIKNNLFKRFLLPI